MLGLVTQEVQSAEVAGELSVVEAAVQSHKFRPPTEAQHPFLSHRAHAWVWHGGVEIVVRCVVTWWRGEQSVPEHMLLCRIGSSQEVLQLVWRVAAWDGFWWLYWLGSIY